MGTRLLSLWVLQNSEGQGVTGMAPQGWPRVGVGRGNPAPVHPPLPRPQQLALEDLGQSQMVASAPENSAKNRYRNVLPCKCGASAVLARVGQHEATPSSLVPLQR